MRASEHEENMTSRQDMKGGGDSFRAGVSIVVDHVKFRRVF